MLRRLLFGLSLALVIAAVIGSFTNGWPGDGGGSWVPALALLGAAVFMVGVAFTIRQLLNGIWKLSRDYAQQRARLAALGSSVAALNSDSGVRDDALLARLVKVEADIAANSEKQVALERRLKRSVEQSKETDRRIQDLTTLVDRVKDRQQEQNRMISEIGSGVNQLGSRHVDFIRPALKRLEESQAEKIRPALRRIEGEQQQGYRQLEAVAGLVGSLRLQSPLPPLRNTWAIDPDSAAFLLGTIFAESPGSIVELGSGSSTVMMAKALEQLGSGRLRSLDHDGYFLEQTRRLLDAESLGDAVELVEAPLAEIVIDGVGRQWYSTDALEGIETIDLVVVDGPPSGTTPEARYPAVPVLASRLRNGSLIFLDDAKREDEQRIVERWLNEYPLVELSVPKTEKGAAMLLWSA